MARKSDWQKSVESLDSLSPECALKLAKALDGIWSAISESLSLFDEHEKTVIAEALQTTGLKLGTKAVLSGLDFEVISRELTLMISQSVFCSRVHMNLQKLERNPK
jgi:hypothetical protein